ncbi:MAG: carbamoyl-phosphate synthase (glutamine-hydrolyzing) large subunit [Nanoarchaeota archaeon]|nr:carbamoyl-phosphate synthase (glutamine-hydrolyzing) large subunit [Nanoarchaeota archaeon]
MEGSQSKRKKIVILGSGALKIGEAGEFDYSGSQAIKALSEEGYSVILVNPNIATVQTDLADKTYFLPVTPEFVEKVIEKEKPYGIVLAFGGQTALNCGIALEKAGVFSRNKVTVLGTSVDSIIKTEDRQLFAAELEKIGVPIARSIAAVSAEEAVRAAKKIGYPVMLRAGFSLGGKGSGVVYDEKELEMLARKALSNLPQILIEEYLGGWKEIEYEIVRDYEDNCIAVCNMENLDPMGIHTGESIVVAPSQTLTNRQYHMLRSASLKVIRHFKILGECNIQYALDPRSDTYRVIEVNARLSRSSALASKATGYPLAYVAAKIACGKSLSDIDNRITKATKACFEPSLDYIVVKIPRWDLQKFKRVSTTLSSEMKSVGEVMAIARTFEEAIQKAIRMLDIGEEGLLSEIEFDDLDSALKTPTDKRIFAIAKALKTMSVEKIAGLTNIDPWFLYKIKEIAEMRIAKEPASLRKAKMLGFSDKQIGNYLGINEDEVRRLRKSHNILPYVKQIDTLAAEYPAKTNYLYMTYSASESDISKKDKGIIVLGSGPYRIGSSVEFDWCSVSCARECRKQGFSPVIVNCNPETVSTDFDEAERLYFEELTAERVKDIYDIEEPHGIIISMGGQTPNNLALPLTKSGCKIMGTSADNIDMAEDRHKFSLLCDEQKIVQPDYIEADSLKKAKEFAARQRYPILLRPSYVLSGSAMNVVHDDEMLEAYLKEATLISKEHPVVATKFIPNAIEIELDAAAKDGEIVAYAISSHIEKAGVHSGDATIVYPAEGLSTNIREEILSVAKRLAKRLAISGPFNIQFLYNGTLMVIECNLRASRSFPFVSKMMNTNLASIATDAILGKETQFNVKELGYVGVKSPQFSFARLKGANPKLGVEMGSTGEVGCIGKTLHEALLKSMLSVGIALPKKAVLLSTGRAEDKEKFLTCARKLSVAGLKIYATKGTHNFLHENGIQSEIALWPLDEGTTAIALIERKEIDLVINIPKSFDADEMRNDYMIRRAAVDFGIGLITDIDLAVAFVEAFSGKPSLDIRCWQEY